MDQQLTSRARWSDLLAWGVLCSIPDISVSSLISRGSSGYGRFNVDNFTDKRVITLHPPKASDSLLLG